jgi:hypothetical protein
MSKKDFSDDLDNVYELKFSETMNKIKSVNKLLEALHTVSEKSNTKELDYKLEQLIRSHCKHNDISLNKLLDAHYQAEYEAINGDGDDFFAEIEESSENGNPYSTMMLYSQGDHDEKDLTLAIKNGGLDIIFKSMNFIEYGNDVIVKLIPYMEKLCCDKTIDDLLNKEWQGFRILLKAHIIAKNNDKFNKIKDEMKKLGIDTLYIQSGGGLVVKYDKNDPKQILSMCKSSLDAKDHKAIKISYDCLMEYIGNNRIRKDLKRDLRATLIRFCEYGHGNWMTNTREEFLDEINGFIDSMAEPITE